MYAFAIKTGVLFFGAIGIIIGVLGISVLQIEYLIENYHLAFVPGEVRLEDSIAIVVAAFGIFLDSRHRLVRMAYGDAVPERENDISDICKHAGIPLILLGVFIEIIDLCFLALTNFGLVSTIVEYSEVAFLFCLNIAALVMIIRFLNSLRSLREQRG